MNYKKKLKISKITKNIENFHKSKKIRKKLEIKIEKFKKYFKNFVELQKKNKDSKL